MDVLTSLFEETVLTRHTTRGATTSEHIACVAYRVLQKENGNSMIPFRLKQT
jgi:hypothetical protein